MIDWKDSKFEKDILYEDINAPQWIDFSSHDPPFDDEAWGIHKAPLNFRVLFLGFLSSFFSFLGFLMY